MRRTRNPFIRAGIYLALSLVAAYSIFPFLWTFLQSIKTVRDANSRTPLWFFEVTWENYSTLWLESTPENLTTLSLTLLVIIGAVVTAMVFAERLPIPRWVVYWLGMAVFAFILWQIPRIVDTAEFYDYFLNTVIVTVGTLIVSITIGCLAGYALARYGGMAGAIILIAALAFRALPRLAFIFPYLWIGQVTGLINTHLLLIVTLVAINQPFTIWMLRSFFRDVPRELEESAMVDGASRLTAFRKVVVPIVWPGIISTSLFTLLLAYNEFLLPRVLTQTNWTLPVAISQFAGGEDPAHITLAAAGAVSITLPIIFVIIFFQRQLVRGLAAGAVKG